MIKGDVKIKDQLGLNDFVDMINYLVSGYFTNGQYTPYYREISDVVVFFKYCVDGLTFETITDEEGNESEEPIYTAVTSDKELMGLYRNFYKRKGQVHETLSAQIDQISAYVKDIVDYEKQYYSSLSAMNVIETFMTDYFNNNRNNEE